jgi:predicted GNAT family N-acyltransferase
LQAEQRLAPTPRRSRGPAELEGAQQLRVRVFCGEQGVSEAAELDGLDDEAIHLVAMDHGKVVGTCRLRILEDGAKLERMAVAQEFRGIGLGRRLAEETETEARREGAERMVLHAQVRARGFYEAAGYSPTSEDVFLEEGIEHVKMEKKL